MPKTKVYITYTQTKSDLDDHYYDPNTFDQDIMFMEVIGHRHKSAPGRYNDTQSSQSGIFSQ